MEKIFGFGSSSRSSSSSLLSLYYYSILLLIIITILILIILVLTTTTPDPLPLSSTLTLKTTTLKNPFFYIFLSLFFPCLPTDSFCIFCDFLFPYLFSLLLLLSIFSWWEEAWFSDYLPVSSKFSLGSFFLCNQLETLLRLFC